MKDEFHNPYVTLLFVIMIGVPRVRVLYLLLFFIKLDFDSLYTILEFFDPQSQPLKKYLLKSRFDTVFLSHV